MSKIRHLLGVVAAGCMVMSAAGQEVTTVEGQTVLFSVDRTTGPTVDPSGLCGATLYNAPDASATGTGRTVGTSSGWIPVQPFSTSVDWTVCGLGVDGWYVTGTPVTCNLNIYPDDGTGNADLSSPLCGNGVDVTMDSDPFAIHWVYGDLAERCCLTANTRYYVAVTPSSSDHWSAVFQHSDGSFQGSYSTNNNGDRFDSGPMCVRILGEEGCGGSDLAIEYTGSCPGDVRVTATNATPGGTVGLVFASCTGNFTIPSGTCAGTQLGLCSTNIQLVQTATADGSGTAFFGGFAPQAACNGFIQAVDTTTCATSNVEQIL